MDTLEKALELFEKEQKEFEGHHLWKQLGCTPKQFFEATQKHITSLNIPKEQWGEAYQKAATASRIRSVEKRRAYTAVNINLLGSIRV